MTVLRNFVLWAAIMLAMPWGAHAGSHRGAQFASALEVAQQQSILPEAAQLVTAIAADMTRLCPGPGLPGSGCGSDNMLMPVGSAPLASAKGQRLWPSKVAQGKGITPATMLDPPKRS